MPKKVRFADVSEEVRVERSGQPIISEDRSEPDRVELNKTETIIMKILELTHLLVTTTKH